MALFSERNGYVKPREIFQIDNLDLRTKNRIWDWVVDNFISKLPVKQYSRFVDIEKAHDLKHIYCDTYGFSADDLQNIPIDPVKNFFRDRFYNNPIYEIYDLLELIVQPWIPFLDKSFYKDYQRAIDRLNNILEQEKVGYRLVNGVITKITNEVEISAIEDALKTEHKSVTDHVQCALKYFADRDNPDYRNAIKECFSAVEAWLKNECGDAKADFSIALQKLKDKGLLDIHPSIIQSFKGFYGYMSDEKGIRHSLLDDSAEFNFADAKYMILFCSTMINYLNEKKK